MALNSLDAVSPVDGRYRKATEPLAAYFSESALMRYRVRVEAAYFAALCRMPLPQLRAVPAETLKAFDRLAADPAEADVVAIKDFEAVTNHDVKAVEYYLKQAYASLLGDAAEFIHFGLTSQDINNTAIPLSVKEAAEQVMLPALQNLLQAITTRADSWRNFPMLARTHGQPATPTTLGKEFAVFAERLQAQLSLLNTIPWSAKFGGATGNFNAHYAAYPGIRWEEFGDSFVASLGLTRSRITTQIEHYDHLAALCDNFRRINTILIDFSRDTWSYISMNYFLQEVKQGEVESSAMPHKVNPIDFENAEGNLGMANAVFSFLSEKLPVSRLQRDLTDSTVLRNIGVPFAHTLIAVKSLLRGLNKIRVNPVALESDLQDNWAVVAEAIQTILRREGFANPYEALKELTRTGEKITRDSMQQFIHHLHVSDAVKKELLAITPGNYIGNAGNFSLR